MDTNQPTGEESVQTPRFRVEKYSERSFAVYDGDDLVVVTLYRKGAVEVAARLRYAVDTVRTLLEEIDRLRVPAAAK